VERAARIGIVLVAANALVITTAFGLGVPDVDPTAILALAILVALTAIGVGLIRGSAIAKKLAIGLFGIFSVGDVVHVVRGFVDLGDAEWSVTAVADALVTSVLAVWLSVRAIQVLLGRFQARAATARLVGIALAVIALAHLQLARSSVDVPGTFSLSLSASGIWLAGFPGWQYWHAGLLAVGIALVASPRRFLRHVATVLLLLVVGLFVPVAVMLGTEPFALVWMFGGSLAIIGFLVCWLRAELK
jgi:hypothetical protein